MTRADHASGTDRVAEVASTLEFDPQSVVVNVQGDEPLLPPEVIQQLGQCLVADAQIGAATLATPSNNEALAADPNVVKVVRSNTGRALYFSRQHIPYYRQREAAGKWLRHIGVYGYRVSVLRDFCTSPRSSLEVAESLEQLRLLAHDVPLLVLDACAEVPQGVDTMEDLERVRRQLASG